jgi:hypothetical protein
MPTASLAVASLTDDAMIRSAINSAATCEDEDKDNGSSAPMRTFKHTSMLLGQGQWLGAGGRQR